LNITIMKRKVFSEGL